MRSKKRIKPFLKYIEKMWVEHPDERFGQLLINAGLLEDSITSWNAEISDYPMPHEVMREIQTWGTYGKLGKNKLKEVFIKDLEISHIKKIIETQKHNSKELMNILKNEIKYRKK